MSGWAVVRRAGHAAWMLLLSGLIALAFLIVAAALGVEFGARAW